MDLPKESDLGDYLTSHCENALKTMLKLTINIKYCKFSAQIIVT